MFNVQKKKSKKEILEAAKYPITGWFYGCEHAMAPFPRDK